MNVWARDTRAKRSGKDDEDTSGWGRSSWWPVITIRMLSDNTYETAITRYGKRGVSN